MGLIGHGSARESNYSVSQPFVYRLTLSRHLDSGTGNVSEVFYSTTAEQRGLSILMMTTKCAVHLC